MSSEEPRWHPIIEEFVKYLTCKDKSENTIISYKNKVQRMLNYLQKSPDESTQDDLDRYKLYLKSGKSSGGAELDRNSYIPISAAINHFMKFLGKKDCTFTAMSARDKPIYPLDADEVARIALIAKQKRFRDYAIICTLYYGALRISDALDLDICNVNFKEKTLTIMDSKGGYNDTINLHVNAIDAIKLYIETDRMRCANEDCTALFVSEKSGERLQRNQAWKMIKEYAVQAKIYKNVNTHIFRHSCLTHMAENGATLPEIMRHSRHREPRCAMKYIHLGEDKVTSAYQRTAPDIFSSETDHQQVENTPNAKNHDTKNSDLIQRAFNSLEKGLISEETLNRLLNRLEQNPIKKEDNFGENLSYIG